MASCAGVKRKDGVTKANSARAEHARLGGPQATRETAAAVPAPAWLDDLRRGRGAWLDAAGFGAVEAPWREACRAEGMRLRAYGPPGPGPVLLLVPAPIKRAYIWDLAPARSVVRRALAAGFEVGLVEWTDPVGEDAAGLGLDDYADLLLGTAADALAALHDARGVLLGGHSLGGTLAAVFAALHPGRVRGLMLVEAPLQSRPRGRPPRPLGGSGTLGARGDRCCVGRGPRRRDQCLGRRRGPGRVPDRTVARWARQRRGPGGGHYRTRAGHALGVRRARHAGAAVRGRRRPALPRRRVRPGHAHGRRPPGRGRRTCDATSSPCSTRTAAWCRPGPCSPPWRRQAEPRPCAGTGRRVPVSRSAMSGRWSGARRTSASGRRSGTGAALSGRVVRDRGDRFARRRRLGSF